MYWPDVPTGESAFIHRLAVWRKFASSGVSGALIDWAKRYAGALGKRSLRLDCREDRQDLCRLYEKAGFRKHSERQVGLLQMARFEYEFIAG